uniref:Uncharacterized protein n=1 Tax=Rhizophora mucronata TaxID=61149 RepID=A0A2P2NXY7_RHIMU
MFHLYRSLYMSCIVQKVDRWKVSLGHSHTSVVGVLKF